MVPQGPFVTVHWKVFVPTGSPVMEVVGEVGAVIVPPPLTNVHVPLAGVGAALAFIVTLLAGVQIDWSGPALAAATVFE